MMIAGWNDVLFQQRSPSIRPLQIHPFFATLGECCCHMGTKIGKWHWRHPSECTHPRFIFRICSVLCCDDVVMVTMRERVLNEGQIMQHWWFLPSYLHTRGWNDVVAIVVPNSWGFALRYSISFFQYQRQHSRVSCFNLFCYLTSTQNRPIIWRNTHPCVIVDRHEDITHPSVLLYAPYANGQCGSCDLW